MSWKTGVYKYKDFPLALRVRSEAEVADVRLRFGRSLVVTHELDHVRPNGMPEPDYNRTLADFDHDVHEFIEGEGDGLVVLVETFAGRRIYYTYVDPASTFKDRFAQLKARHPGQSVSIGNRMDPGWETRELYRNLFPDAFTSPVALGAIGPSTEPGAPIDFDAVVLGNLAASGNDMTGPMEIDFPVVLKTEDSADRFATIAAGRGYKVRKWKHRDDPNWDVVCAITMVPRREEIIRIQQQLTNWASELGGYCVSWGTFGNKVPG